MGGFHVGSGGLGDEPRRTFCNSQIRATIGGDSYLVLCLMRRSVTFDAGKSPQGDLDTTDKLAAAFARVVAINFYGFQEGPNSVFL